MEVHDAILDVDCSWSIADDGELRCLPEVFATFPEWAVYFKDASCTEPIYLVAPGACAPDAGSYVSVETPSCPVGREIYELGAVVPNVTQLYATFGGSCTSAGGIDQYIPLSMAKLVGGTETLFDESGGLAPVFVDGGDGSSSFSTLRDPANGDVDCGFELADDTKTRCLPSTPVSIETSEFTDAGCTSPVAAAPAGSCASYPFAKLTSSGCPASTTIHAVGGLAAAIYFDGPGGCSQQLVSGPDFHTLGATIPPSSFAPGTISNAAGASRLVPRVVGFGGLAVLNEIVDSVAFHDTERDEPCVPRIANDGALRCLPMPVDDLSSQAYAVYYADDLCTTLVGISVLGCGTPTTAVGVPTCDAPETAVYAIEGTFPGNEIYVPGSGGSCAVATIPPGVAVFTLGAEIDPTEFVELGENIH